MNIVYWTGWFLAKCLGRVVYRFEIMGRENIPKQGAFIVASNHISYVDPPLVGSFIKREMHFMAKKELFRNRLFGGLMKILNSHPVNRGGYDRKAINTAIEILTAGHGLLIFPEGTRSLTDDFLPARPGIGMVAINSRVPVVPAYITGSNRPWACLMGKKRAVIAYGMPITQHEVAGYRDDRDGYQALSEEIMNRIKKLRDELSPVKAQAAKDIH